MINVQFKTSEAIERTHLRDLFDERRWFLQQGFDAPIPDDLRSALAYRRAHERELKQRLVRVCRRWRAVEPAFFQRVRRFQFVTLTTPYDCHVTLFGPSGQYRPPRTVFLRLRTARDEREAPETIGHELLHLCFARVFARKHFSYREREGMVDALVLESGLRKMFPSYRAQTIGTVRPRILVQLLNRTG